ncbi:asparaginase [Halopiger djelfimassiliensis]|uniref:asparaginase n=1 Tax=Halopiger djelfimassiliensis TaxID=1293047 RepID=UPI0006775FD2|nr:asparaginase [Halopiger djelfimassiliensis]
MHVTVLSTGGTIASTAAEDGAHPTKRGQDLVAAVPELKEYASLTVEEVARVPSYEMDAETLETIGERVRAITDADGSDAADAVVVTHGTDTMEETAYYLDVAVQPETPVFLTGAQRRPDEVSPDGPANLLTAVRAGRAFADRGAGGTFVAFDEAIHAARTATKVHTSRLDAFRSRDAGPVATVDREGVTIHRPPQRETRPLPATSLEPAVRTIKSGSCATGELVEAAVERGADGLVIEGTGLGNATAGIADAVRAAIDDGIPAVVTSRCLEGRTTPVYGGVGGGQRLRAHGAVFAGGLSAQQARIRLTLALEAFDDPDVSTLRSAFADDAA